MWVRITMTPTGPRVGDDVTISVLTYYLTEMHCDADAQASPIPHSDWSPPLESVVISVEGPDGTALRQALARRSSDPAYWDGTWHVSAPGTWVVRVVQPGFSQNNAETCAGARATVTVPPDGSQIPLVPWIAAAAMLAVAGALVARQLQRRMRQLQR